MEDGHEFRRDLLVPLHSHREKNPVGAAPAGLPQWHGGTNAVFPRLVRTGGNHAAGSRAAADNDRLPPVGWVVPLLHRRVKSIHIQMDNPAHPLPSCSPLTAYMLDLTQQYYSGQSGTSSHFWSST